MFSTGGVALSRAYVLEENTWAAGQVSFDLQLGDAGGTLADGNTSWDQVALQALQIWNPELGTIQLVGNVGATSSRARGNRINNVFFSANVYDNAFGSGTLAVTVTTFQVGGNRVESDVLFNASESWNSYRGNTRDSATDLRRVAIHEFGHALGLDHPDDSGQMVSAIMNARVGNLDTIVADDIGGVKILYGRYDGSVDDHGNNQGSATSVAPKSNTAGMLGTGGDIDYFVVTLPTAGVISVSTKGSTDTKGRLLDASGSVLATDDDSGSATNFRIVRSGLAAGAYTIAVEGKSSDTTGPYELAVNFEGTSTEPPGAKTARLINLAVRARAGETGPLIAGFVTSGGKKSLLVRASGPAIAAFGVTNVLADPLLEVFAGSTQIDRNDNWQASSVAAIAASVGAFVVTPGSPDAALSRSFDAGPYTAQASGVGGTTGTVVVEIYDADALSASGRLVNLSTRTFVASGDRALTAGFVIGGEGKLRLLIRGVGPTLSEYGVSGAISDPVIEVLSGQTVVASNDDWGSDNSAAISAASAQVGAFTLVQERDSALLLELSPGPYTVRMQGYENSTGEGLIEVYEVP